MIAAQYSLKDRGHYVVLLTASENLQSEAAARLLKLEPIQLGRLLSFSLPLPARRAATEAEAVEIQTSLRQLGLDSLIIADDESNLESPFKKARALEFIEGFVTGAFVGTNTQARERLDDLILLVTGRLISNRIELEERKRRGRKQTVDSRHLSADETVLDLYFRDSNLPWRIKANSFDFSCLGSNRAFTVYENFTALIDFIRERAALGEIDNSYAQARPLLEIAWPLAPKTRTGEWRRSGAGKFDLATVTTTDNEDQFSRYSRLRYRLRLRDLNKS